MVGLVQCGILAISHAFVRNMRCGLHDIATDTPDHRRLRIAFDDLARPPGKEYQGSHQ